MDITIDLTAIILAIITLMGAIITKYLIPWVKGKTTETNRQTLCDIVQSVVYGVDRMMKTATGKQKKDYVVNILRKYGYDVNIDDVTDELNLMIESAVEQLRNEQRSEGAY